MASCEDLTIKKYIFTGEQGEKGDKGDPGDSVAFPIAASNISVTNAGFSTAQEIFDYLLFAPMTINSFTTPTILFENRASTDASADFTILWSWALSKAIVSPGSQTLTGPGTMTPVSLVLADRSKLVTMTDFNTTSNFTLTVTDELGTPTSAIVPITFTNKIYYGDAAIPGAIDSTFILSLTGSLQSTNTKTIASDTDATKYFWFATPTAYGTPTFMVGAFPMDMQTPVAVSPFTNSLGHTENYNVYRATNHSLGAIFVDVT